RIARVRCYSRARPASFALFPTRLSRAVATLSRRLRVAEGGTVPCGSTACLVFQPPRRKACRLGTARVWADPGSLAATTGIVSVPRGTEMFQFPRCPPHREDAVITQGDGVAPFGDRGIGASSRLPHAYRSNATSFIGTQRRG